MRKRTVYVPVVETALKVALARPSRHTNDPAHHAYSLLTAPCVKMLAATEPAAPPSILVVPERSANTSGIASPKTVRREKSELRTRLGSGPALPPAMSRQLVPSLTRRAESRVSQ